MTAEVSDWIYCRLVNRGTFIFPRRPFWLGQVEFSDKNKDDPDCAKALGASMSAFAVSEAGDGWAKLVRARVLLPGVDADTARKFGWFHLAETLVAFNAHLSMGMSELLATDAGYIYDVKTRTVSPLMPPWKGRDFKGTSAMMDEVAHHPLHVLNTLYVAPDSYGELANAFRRSSHWRELAARAEDEGQALLLYWMAAECLCKQAHDEEIGSKLAAVCGFPTGSIAKKLSPAASLELNSITAHRLWRKRLLGLFDAVRVARNQIVHSGYRYVDLPDLLRDDQRALGMLVLPIVAKLLAEMALHALNYRVTTLTEMWERYETFVAPDGLTHLVTWMMQRLESASTTATSSTRWR